jgi:GntR family transcriptional repressor for pyruvate dehydrogenase complex
VSVFTSINSASRSQLVREQLEQAIDSGVFAPGSRLPSERELVEQFGVSRVSVREALRSLEALSLIKVVAGRGCFVRGDLVENRDRTVRQWLSSHSAELTDLLRVRAAIETLGAEEAARRCEPVSLAQLEEAHNAFVTAVEEGAALSELVERDVRFHEALADASGNPLVAELTRQLNSYLVEARQVTLAPPGRPNRSAREHGAIVAAVLVGDEKAAGRAMRNHVKSVQTEMAKFKGDESD